MRSAIWPVSCQCFTVSSRVERPVYRESDRAIKSESRHAGLPAEGFARDRRGLWSRC